MSRGQQSDAEFCFEDLFEDDDEENVNDADASGPKRVSAENASTVDAEKGISALTLTFNQMQMEENERTNRANDLRRDVELKWSSIHARQDNPTRLGSSAPVRIPQRSLTWSAHNTDRLQQINEDGDVELQRATTFVPPHLTVEQPAIQFSLNSGLAEKRAMLKAREKILSFIESDDQAFVDMSDFRIPTGAPSGLSREFGGGTSSRAVPRPPAA